jgi:hypothetical protein
MKKQYVISFGLLLIILFLSITFNYIYYPENNIIDQFFNKIKCLFKTNKVDTDKSIILTKSLQLYNDTLPHKINSSNETIGLWPNENATIYVRGNMPANVEIYCKKVIGHIINDFNSKSACFQLKLVDLETIIMKETVKNMGDNLSYRYFVQFFVYDTKLFISRKLNIQWEDNPVTNKPRIQFIQTEGAGEQIYNELNRIFVHGVDTPFVEQEANTLSADTHGKLFSMYDSLDGPAIYKERYEKIKPCDTNDTRVESALCRNAQTPSDWSKVTQNIGYSQEPCKEEAIYGQKWDRYGVYKQTPSATKCNVSNYGYSKTQPDLYDNPTIYTMPFPGEKTISQTNVLPYAQDIYSYVK